MNEPFGLPGAGPVPRFESLEAQGWLPRGWISGLVLSNDTTDATNDIAISAGVCRSTVNAAFEHSSAPSTLDIHQRDIRIPASVIKQLDVAWAPENYNPDGYPSGGRSGGRSQSAISDTTWHVYTIGGAGVQDDILLHDSATQSSVLAALPSGYTAYRRIGSILRVSGAIVVFIQTGDYFNRSFLITDYDSTNPGTSAVTVTISVPLGVNVLADVVFIVVNANAGNNTLGLLSDLAANDHAPGASATQISDSATLAGGVLRSAAPVQVRTNTSAQIRSRISASNANITARIVTRGWFDQRDRDA